RVEDFARPGHSLPKASGGRFDQCSRAIATAAIRQRVVREAAASPHFPASRSRRPRPCRFRRFAPHGHTIELIVARRCSGSTLKLHSDWFANGRTGLARQVHLAGISPPLPAVKSFAEVLDRWSVGSQTSCPRL